ncbi:MAG: hypothetical protein LBJ77_02215 [Holosporales bacterium]|jgi:hypothetical protein|nr:hypothetical protein [Holosporales bacterium]
MRIKVVRAVLAMILANGAIHASQQHTFQLTVDSSFDQPNGNAVVIYQIGMKENRIIDVPNGPNALACREQLNRLVDQGLLVRLTDSNAGWILGEMLFKIYAYHSDEQIVLQGMGVNHYLPTQIVTGHPIFQAEGIPVTEEELLEQLNTLEMETLLNRSNEFSGPLIRVEGDDNPGDDSNGIEYRKAAIYTTPSNLKHMRRTAQDFDQAVIDLYGA